MLYCIQHLFTLTLSVYYGASVQYPKAIQPHVQYQNTQTDTLTYTPWLKHLDLYTFSYTHWLIHLDVYTFTYTPTLIHFRLYTFTYTPSLIHLHLYTFTYTPSLIHQVFTMAHLFNILKLYNLVSNTRTPRLTHWRIHFHLYTFTYTHSVIHTDVYTLTYTHWLIHL